ncbi:hypothetical protein TOPH_00458 [Tolypocladium ophioglossoides CBS 100239]|uniref:Uncharacterized protein n=1 Tax=Tolypocladium ophioglossoides (strain CBS 100239) TaxID=1163406 RepID=A0A0L0NKZ8_TOLOC|nr:hypothetical protein TOPH_00458 [Tolypocladium ophioglossoides CBS 100239]
MAVRGFLGRYPRSHMVVYWTAITLTFTSSSAFVPVLTKRLMTTHDDSTNEHTGLLGNTIRFDELKVRTSGLMPNHDFSSKVYRMLNVLNDGEPILDWTSSIGISSDGRCVKHIVIQPTPTTIWNMFLVEADTGCQQGRRDVDQPAGSGWIVDSRKSEACPWGSAEELDRTFCFCCAETGCGASSNLSCSLAPYLSERTLPELPWASRLHI